jgi:hypothetical protein
MLARTLQDLHAVGRVLEADFLMTFSLAKARGFSRPEHIRTNTWYALCPTCNAEGPMVSTRGEASRDAREHNAQHHANGEIKHEPIVATSR